MCVCGWPRASKAPRAGLVSNRRSGAGWPYCSMYVCTPWRRGRSPHPPCSSPQASPLLTGLHTKVWESLGDVAGPRGRLTVGKENPSEPAYTYRLVCLEYQSVSHPASQPEATLRLAGRGGGSEGFKRQARAPACSAKAGKRNIIVWLVAMCIIFPLGTQPGMHAHAYIYTYILVS